MGMGFMVIVWGKTVIKSPSAGTYSFNNSMIHEKIQDTVYCHAVNAAAAFKGVENILGRQRKAVVTNDLQDSHPVIGRTKAGIG